MDLTGLSRCHYVNYKFPREEISDEGLRQNASCRNEREDVGEMDWLCAGTARPLTKEMPPQKATAELSHSRRTCRSLDFIRWAESPKMDSVI
jgi:hypothetical protein